MVNLPKDPKPNIGISHGAPKSPVKSNEERQRIIKEMIQIIKKNKLIMEKVEKNESFYRQ